MGLGLSLVKAIAEAHEGRAEAESTLGRGSTFLLRLPRQPAVTAPR
jgi:signal transduction histidine kinase